jgi:hypothetical protein
MRAVPNPSSAATTKASRITVTEISKRRASPAQTPAIMRPSSLRIHSSMPARPRDSRNDPQCRHLIASARISSAQ